MPKTKKKQKTKNKKQKTKQKNYTDPKAKIKQFLIIKYHPIETNCL